MAKAQRTLEGMGIETIPEITEAAEKYEKARDKRLDVLKTELELKRQLLELLHKHKIKNYRDDDLIVLIVEAKENVKVKREGEEEAEEE